jgi:hypothetical protein
VGKTSSQVVDNTMSKDLIFIDGQEGFVDLDFFIQMDVCNYYRTSKDYIKYSIQVPGFTDDSKLLTSFIKKVYDLQNGWLRMKSFHNIEYPFSRSNVFKNSSGVDLKRRLTVLDISRNNVSREFSKFSSSYDSEIDYWNNRIKYYRTLKFSWHKKDSYYRKKQIEKCTRQIRKIFILKNKNPWVSDYEKEFNLVHKLTKKCPEKFSSVYKDVFTTDIVNQRYDVYVFRVSSQIIPYLEQQVQLGRIELKDDEMVMLKALKEAMRIRDESMSFNDYIDNWTKKLLEKK